MIDIKKVGLNRENVKIVGLDDKGKLFPRGKVNELQSFPSLEYAFLPEEILGDHIKETGGSIADIEKMNSDEAT